MSTFNIFFTFSILITLSSCSLSRTFHKPQKNLTSIDNFIYVVIGNDTSYVEYHEENNEINFRSSSGRLINQNYSIKDTFFVSANGNKLNGWLLSPINIKPVATILHFHGSASNLFFHYKTISPLVNQGFQVFTFDYSGYGFSEGKASRKNALADAYSALDFVQNHYDYDQLIIYGQSYGGYLASIVGANKQSNIDGIVIEGAFSSHKKEANASLPVLGLLVKNEEIATEEIRKNEKPLLIIHSSEDKKVPLKFGLNIFEHANEPKEFYEIGQAHCQGLQYYSEEISKKIKMMLDR